MSPTPQELRRLVTDVINLNYRPNVSPYDPEKSLRENGITGLDFPELEIDIEQEIKDQYGMDLDLGINDITPESTLDYIVKAIQLKLGL